MAIRFATHLKQLPPWFNVDELEDGVILGSMGRLVRNLKGECFPGWSTKESRARVAATLTPIVRSLPGFKQAAHAEMTELDHTSRKLLLERKQITPCLGARQDGSHVFINKKQDTIIMLNEEEHVAIHQFATGNRLQTIVTDLRKKAALLEKQADMAYTKEYGYLTSMAAESGDGLQFYMVLHLPGHAMLNQIDKLERALNKLHLNIAPFYTEYGEETGHLYVLFSTPAPVGTSNDILGHLNNIAESLVQKELLLRTKVTTEDFMTVSDAVGRIYGCMQHGTLMKYPEMLNYVSMIRFASEQGMLTFELPEEAMHVHLSQLVLLCAPTHIAYMSEESAVPTRNALRMHMLKALSAQMTLNVESLIFPPSFA